MISSQELTTKNEWWQDKNYQVEEFEWIKRDLYSQLIDNLDHTLMLNIVGLRRVGKSTLLKQLAGFLLRQKIDPKNIFYYLFDYGSQPQKQEFLDEVLFVYFQEILKKPIYAHDEQVYILLDEVQYINNWQAVLKRHYDLSGKKIKFIVTGSQSILLKDKNHESLAGRVFDFYLPPMTFRELTRINKEQIKILEPYDLFDLRGIFSNLAGYDAFHSQKIIDLAKEYIIAGQFPETRSIKPIEKKHDYIIESVIGKVLEDCVNVFKIDKTDEFKLITRHLLNNASSIFELKNIGREAGVSFITLNKYMGYLKDSYMIEILYKYHKSLIKQGRILKKVYTPSVNFTCALNHYTESHIEEVPQAFGKIIENAIYNVLRQKYKDDLMNENLSFWRQGQKEIDFILSQKNQQLPIEVKFSNNYTAKDLKAMTDFIEVKKLDFGAVVTRNELAKKQINGQTLYFLPYYLTLMMV